MLIRQWLLNTAQRTRRLFRSKKEFQYLKVLQNLQQNRKKSDSSFENLSDSDELLPKTKTGAFVTTSMNDLVDYGATPTIDKFQFLELLIQDLLRKNARLRYQKHVIETKDGYTIQLFQMFTINTDEMSKPLEEAKSVTQKRAILLQHGLMETGSVYLLLGVQSLAYRLANDLNMNVFISNCRDFNKHLNTYCIDELIEIDAPVLIKTVKNLSQQEKIFYCGMSQGTVMGLGSLNVNKELQKDIQSIFLLSPAFYLNKITFWENPVVYLLARLPWRYMSRGGYHSQFMPIIYYAQMLVPDWLVAKAGYFVMHNLLKVVNLGLFNYTIYPYVPPHPIRVHEICFRYIPGSPNTSTLNMIQWFQFLLDGSYVQPMDQSKPRNYYDYLSFLLQQQKQQDNQEAEYPSIYCYLGKQDPLINSNRTRDTLNQIYCTKTFVQEMDDFSHSDFLWSEEQNVIPIYNQILQQIQQEIEIMNK